MFTENASSCFKPHLRLTTLFVIYIVVLTFSAAVQVSADYDAEDTGYYNSDMVSNDEVFDPAHLQQEVESRQTLENHNTPSYYTDADEDEIMTHVSQMKIGIGMNKIPIDDHSPKDPTEEIATNADDITSGGTVGSFNNDAFSRQMFPTTIIPEYVRKLKTDIFAATVGKSGNVKVALADSYNDENHHSSIGGKNESGVIIPFVMKSNVLYNENEDNKLNDQSMPLARKKHHQQLENSFNISIDEDYYEDSPEIIEQLNAASLLGTTTTMSTTSITNAAAAASTTTTFNPTHISTTILPFAATITTVSHPTIQLPSIGRSKQGKQIYITRRKLLPHEQLRNYIEDAYIRMPLAVIVDPSPDSLEKTKALWRDALRSNFAIKIVLVAINASGIPAAYSFNNTRQFLAGLNSIKESSGGNAFVGVVHASELVPYDSAVFISTASIPVHTELVQDAAITLLKKRIRLYLIWYGEKSISENETQEAVGGILGEVAVRSGGEILHVVGIENSREIERNTLTLVAEAYHGSHEVEIPVDTTLSSLHIKIDSPVRTATLETPNGG